MLLDTHFVDFGKSNERMFNFLKITWRYILGVLVSEEFFISFRKIPVQIEIRECLKKETGIFGAGAP